jgi:CRP-like cAMP-binding protein
VPAKKRAPAENRLLAALSLKEREHLLAGCNEVNLVFGDTLCERGDRIQYVYFPTDSFISMVTKIDGEPTVEVGMVGNEGMAGISLIRVNISPIRTLVQGAGTAQRMTAAMFCRELEHSPALNGLLQRYLFVLISQIAQTAACTRFHVLEARTARWLLMTQDRAHSNKFHVTQEFLSYMLGVRRVGVNKVAVALQKRQLIGYRRGEVTILDRRGLEAASCSCYRNNKKIYERILGKL